MFDGYKMIHKLRKLFENLTKDIDLSSQIFEKIVKVLKLPMQIFFI